jgi:hypothetical protein
MIYIEGMKGLGDNIYQRAFVREFKERIYLETPWPELYQDIPNVVPVRSYTELRTQRKNERASKHQWSVVEGVTSSIRCFYRDQGIFRGMRESLGVWPRFMDLPDFGESCVKGRYYVVRPVTVRHEWPNEARNPDPQYIAKACAEIRKRGGVVVSVADLAQGQEWPIDPMPEADITFHNGELSVSELMALCAGAEALVGPVGWIVPAAMALNKPAFIVCGGQGGYNHPNMLTHELIPHQIQFVMPDNMCMCYEKDHKCDKRISDYDAILGRWLDLGR